MTIQKKIILTTTIVCFLCATVIGANILIISTRNLEKNINASNAVTLRAVWQNLLRGLAKNVCFCVF
ncbi:hypothetical protein HPC63_13975 [Treponema phagedenis]|nr:hypothetical protein [Treponema phagedenis]